ncbi:hypothetical protein NM208_g473 [Fusarium decemcellulare]|uniref:Uncharacterized protein n=1 Tax=Fusarium decemcellulare TaxID=57161 RepID=A0ACC1SZK2_9HYPO|nr:hypothetical protein NM208_g473 [Fusarium decemcellulare]
MVKPHNKPTEYRLAVPQQQVISKLFHINSESRHVAIRFYRVQLPCRYGARGQRTEENGTFYFNPELDTLAIRDVWNQFPKFAHDLWVNDPKRVGLINLMVSEGASYASIPNERFNMPLLRQVVSRLECVTFGRTFLSLKTDPNGFMNCDPRWRGIIPKSEKMSYNVRPMEAHLKHVDLGPKDLRRDVYEWLKALLRWQVEYSDHKVDYQVIAGFMGMDGVPEILKCDDGFRWVGHEEWRAALPPIQFRFFNQKRIREMSQELRPAPQPALGFWLFPLEALGPLADNVIDSQELHIFMSILIAALPGRSQEMLINLKFVDSTAWLIHLDSSAASPEESSFRLLALFKRHMLILCPPLRTLITLLFPLHKHLALSYASSINTDPRTVCYQSISSTGYEMTDTFPQFPRLPREIRLMIWELSLHRKRILHVDLTLLRPLPEPWKWAPILWQQNMISKFFRVNSESRYAALRFYRVHLPCEYQCNGRVEKNATFYFNPELDIIQITGWKMFGWFAHSLWVNDPRHVGLINLKLTSYDYLDVKHDQTNMPLLRQVVSRLERVIFGCSFFLFQGEWDGSSKHVWPCHYDSIPDFDGSTYDFRSMQAHLRDIDLRRHLQYFEVLEQDIGRWLATLARWQVQYHDHEVDYRLMFSHLGKHDEPGTGDRSNRPRWIDFTERPHVPPIGQSNIHQRPRHRPALGFWLIPMEVCAASLPDIRRNYGLLACAHRSLDLAELYLFHLPPLAWGSEAAVVQGHDAGLTPQANS